VLLGIPVFAVWSRKSVSEALPASSPGPFPGGSAENGESA
jgi:hypothetical protein